MKAVVFTLGCKVNSCESESLIAGLKSKGYETIEELCAADLYIINTCAVTAEAEKKSRQTIARARKFNENAKIIVTGCASQKVPEDFLKKKGVTLVTGAKSKDKILAMLDETGVAIEKRTNITRSFCPKKQTEHGRLLRWRTAAIIFAVIALSLIFAAESARETPKTPCAK